MQLLQSVIAVPFICFGFFISRGECVRRKVIASRYGRTQGHRLIAACNLSPPPSADQRLDDKITTIDKRLVITSPKERIIIMETDLCKHEKRLFNSQLRRFLRLCYFAGCEEKIFTLWLFNSFSLRNPFFYSFFALQPVAQSSNERNCAAN